ncbi:MAG: N-(5'-phosphoribosyl)anthranilate isomerase [Acidobacteria bacterium]|nr:MAG: N-(5'-phosphoribosyl)anthranilate isomerase [Acidobacteriota bacterium]
MPGAWYVERRFVTWVKICGITSLEDAQVAVEAGANAVGFVFYEKSPRKVGIDAARKIIGSLPANIERVGVFVNPGPETGEIVRQVGLTAIQLCITFPTIPSGEAAASVPQKRVATGSGHAFGEVNVYLVLPAAGFVDGTAQWSSSGQRLKGIRAVFLDSSTPQHPGGTGKTFDWASVAETVSAIAEQTNVVIAGGLTPANVREAIRILDPWGVDVSSGVEREPGKKDPEKVHAFVKSVRQAEQNR